MIHQLITDLISYALHAGLLFPEDEIYATNRVLEYLKIDDFTPCEPSGNEDRIALLAAITDYACSAGLIPGDIVSRDLFDTGLMGCLTPAPSTVIGTFREKYARSPEEATDWYYAFSKASNYIRTDRIARNLVWKAETDFGVLDVTINLSKPEKPPVTLEAVRSAKNIGYPKCLLCVENEGYAGRYNHPARQNHRIIPMVLNGEQWFLQYSPYSYYNEHCIALSREHTPMVIDGNAIRQLLEFVTLFPHYFIGSNADLPIVGGSIFSHAHFQGGRYEFAMNRAPVETPLSFPGYEDISAGIVRWPLSTIRLETADPGRLAVLAEKILSAWRGYSDPGSFIHAQTDGVPHNTITPIARRNGENYVLDLVLRNNITTEDYPLGYFHPHSELHHIKKENIGLIEVMGLAVLPPRLKPELEKLKRFLLDGTDPASDPDTEKHAAWAEELTAKYTFTEENADEILRREIGVVFANVLQQCGVFARTREGKEAFLRFAASVK